MNTGAIKNDIGKYYSEKIKIHGSTPQGVDWNGEESQYIRFHNLLKIVNTDSFSLLDYGCGYGALLPYMTRNFSNFNYSGFDISNEMIAEAIKLHKEFPATWSTDSASLMPADFVVASGIFNVKQDVRDDLWQEYMIETLKDLNRLSTCGFAFNVLTKYSEKEKMRDYLFYADPLWLFDHCKTEFSTNVALLHDYKLFEFTLLIRKNIL
jgi:SAM-dependent methyltransferase